VTARKRLPNRRHAETFELTVGGLRYVCPSVASPTARSASCFSRTTNQTAPQIRTRATWQLSSASRFSTARIWKKSAKPLSRDSAGRPARPLGKTLDLLRED
jgi:hypothetical protein